MIKNLLFETSRDNITLNLEESVFSTTRTYDRENIQSINKYTLATYQIFTSGKRNIAKRSYVKFSSFLADTSSIVTQFLLIFYFVFNYTNEKLAYQEIMLKSMKYLDSADFDFHLLKQTVINSNFPAESSRQSLSVIPRCVIKAPIKEYSPLNMAEDKFSINQDTKNYKFVKMNTCHYLLSLCLCNKRKVWKRNKELVEKTQEKVHYFLDVMTYIEKFQEIECLKHILFSKEERHLFDFISSPSLIANSSISELEKVYEEKKELKQKLSQEKLEILIKGYNEVQENQNKKERTKKLVNIYFNEIRSL